MDHKPLPAHPSLEQYKKQAKELLKAYRSADVETIRRVKRNHPRFEKLAEPGFDISKFALADAQLVIAREHGFESWPKFTKRIEVINSEAAALDESSWPLLLRRRSGTEHWKRRKRFWRRIRRLRARAFTWRRFWATMRRCGASSLLIREMSQRKKRLMTAMRWSICAFQNICGWIKRGQRLFCARLRRCWTRALIRTAASGAKDEYHDFETALYGAAGVAHHAELTRLLLERGADPNDNETFYHAPETYDNDALKALVESGKMRPDLLAGMLLRKADIHDYDGMKYLLEHGADPNLMTMWGYTALHQAIRRDNALRNIELMLDHGADPTIKTVTEIAAHFPPVDGQRSAVALAARRGRADVLWTFARRGFPMPMPTDGVEHLIVSACAARGGMAGARAFAEQFQQLANAASLPKSNELRSIRELLAEGSTLLAEFAGNGNTKGVQNLLDLGVPVDALYHGDPYFDIAKNSTALHVAAWKAWPKTVKLLIERGANVNAQDAKGRTALMLAVKACVDSYWTNRRSPESVEALLKAGASVSGVDYPSGYDEVDALLKSYER